MSIISHNLVIMKVYQLLGDIKLEFDESHQSYAPETYHRELDLNTATARVTYSVGDVEFTREHFASNPDQVIVIKISASKPGSLSFIVSMDSKLHHSSHIIDGQRQIVLQGSCRGVRIPPKMDLDDNPKGIQYSAVLSLEVSDGSGVVHDLDEKKLKVNGSDWAILRLVASSSFKGPFTEPSLSGKDPSAESFAALKKIKNLSYSDLYARHLNDYQSLFHRVSLHLSKSSKNGSSSTNFGGKEVRAVSTAERVKSFKTDEDPSLVELLFQYSRYLLISCSRPGTQVANLQGIWNKNIEPAWE